MIGYKHLDRDEGSICNDTREGIFTDFQTWMYVIDLHEGVFSYQYFSLDGC